MIIKSFRNKNEQGYCGQSVESWTKRWDGAGDILEKAEAADKDYLSCFFKKFFPRYPKKILEGGCGLGQYVIAYRKLGYNMIGVDFSSDTIKHIKQIDDSLPLYGADVTALPFADGSFDCYFSGGVIEHFEEGPDAPLREARRVLKKGGILLVTVPYINLLRKIRYTIFSRNQGSSFLIQKTARCRREHDVNSNYEFCEYYFDPASLSPYLKASGFLVENAYPVNFLWGEIGMGLHRFIRQYHDYKIRKTGSMKTVKDPARPQGEHDKKSLIEFLCYDFLITENRDNIFYHAPITALNHLSGHMILFVAKAV